jgi:L-fucose mutarotase/ribose pyranase (RbsD/FucU family)
MARGHELDSQLIFSSMSSSPVFALRYRETALYGNLILKKGVIGSTGE